MENSTTTGCSNHVSIEISPMHEPLVCSIKESMEKAASQGCICRVYPVSVDERAHYAPDKVSIGPFHHGISNLKSMEDQKWRYLHALVNRKQNQRQLEASLNACVEAIKELEHKARLFYKDNDQRLCRISSDEFVKMMVVDGGFIIELFLKSAIKGLKRRNDPVFSTPGMLYCVRCNLVMIENQLPFFILQELYRILPIPKQCTHSITDLAFIFFKSMIPGDHQLHKEKFSQESNHLLDLLRHCYLPTIPRIQAKQPTEQYSFRGTESATNLKAKSGIKLRRSRTQNLLDIRFNKGILEIPTIQVHHFTETLFRNFIAFEQCPCNTGNSGNNSNNPQQHISSYVLLLKSLIESDRDVKFLDNQDILLTDDNVNEEDLPQLFKRLANSALKGDQHELKDFYFDGLWEQVKGYKTWSSSWKRKESSSTSTSTSTKNPVLFVAAFLVVALTFFGTLFSALSFFHHH